MDRETWALTVRLLEAVDPETRASVAALAHLGAAILLFQTCDAPIADALMQFAEWLTDGGQVVADLARDGLAMKGH